MMAEVLDSYDKVDHSKVQFGDWEALSIHEADSRGSEDDSSQSGQERDSRSRLVRKDRDSLSTSNGDGRKDPDGPPPSYQQSGSPRKSFVTEAHVGKVDGDDFDAAKTRPIVSIHRYSISSNPGSTTSSLVESPTSISFPQSPTTPTSTVVSDTAKPAVRFTDRGPPRTFARRPATSRRSSSNAVPMAAEWGVLFDDKGYATFRNGQFLRGLAKHIIDDFAPNSSNLVITPEKLSVLYSKYRLDSEVCPFLEVFNSRARDINDRIADFFSDLDCQYHLIQLDSYSRPRVPALTPIGFAQFLTTCILAHPDEEFRRLDKIVADVQILVAADPPAADGQQPEKLPRQLVRSQFPVKHDPKSRKILAAALDDLMYDLRLMGPVNSRPPLAIMPPPANSSFPGARHYGPPEKRFVGKDGYAVPVTSETSKVRSRYLPPEPLRAASEDDGVDRERPRGRYEDEPENYHQQSPIRERPPPPPPPPARSSSYSLLPGPSSASTASLTRPPSYLRSYSSTGPPPAPSTNSATAAYTPTYRRAQSPPLRTYRASAPDVSSASASTYYKPPAGYSPSSPPSPATERREHPLASSLSAAADTGFQDATTATTSGSRRSSAAEMDAPPPPPPPHQQIVLARSSTIPEAKKAAGSTSSSQAKPDYSTGSGSKRASMTTSTSALMNTSEKKQPHHRRRRSAVVAVEHDRGPTWEEALKAQQGGSSSSSSSSHHRHHHRTGSSGKSGGGGSRRGY
ncbi:hypothetical protein F4821DRAFT_108715 [Hypoxylon rubiginosum]|uniref:Uncharacterized protein n=1 Tax=Hypoxylon rubiginosum TaxID=110542 RepID=A0ACC0DIV4_9PEZI|nr:hypothetical protein F4821DRAFT_108715 [Hypoxylon rubiginosum]